MVRVLGDIRLTVLLVILIGLLLVMRGPTKQPFVPVLPASAVTERLEPNYKQTLAINSPPPATGSSSNNNSLNPSSRVANGVEAANSSPSLATKSSGASTPQEAQSSSRPEGPINSLVQPLVNQTVDLLPL